MATIYYDKDADLAILKDRVVGVIGYGNQGHAQAQNMRDTGLEVIIGNIDDEYKASAIRDGFEVSSINKAAESADVVLMLIPDEVQPKIYQEQIRPHLRAGNILCFASGYNVHYRRIVPESKVDTIMVAPRMIGQAVRNLYKQGSGFPCLIATAQGEHDGGFLHELGGRFLRTGLATERPGHEVPRYTLVFQAAAGETRRRHIRYLTIGKEYRPDEQ